MGFAVGSAGLVACLALAACSSGGPAADVAAPVAENDVAPNVESIFRRMSERYRTARTYRDEGTLTRTRRTTSGVVTDTSTMHLRTMWTAAGRFLFEMEEGDSSPSRKRTRDRNINAIWTPEAKVTKSLFLGKVTDEPSLDRALFDFRGLSLGTSDLVPRWLLEGRVQTTASYELRRRTQCGRNLCYELLGTFDASRRVAFFIDTNIHAVRKAVWWTRFPPTAGEPVSHVILDGLSADEQARVRSVLEAARDASDSEISLELDPIFDAPIDEALFAYVPSPATLHDDWARRAGWRSDKER